MSCETEEQTVEGAVAGNECSRKAVVSDWDMGASHSSNTAYSQGQGTENVDQGVYQESRVVGELNLGSILASLPRLLLSLSTKGKEDGDVEGGRRYKGDEDVEVMGEQTEVLVRLIDPTL